MEIRRTFADNHFFLIFSRAAMNISVAIIEDEQLYREHLRAIVTSTDGLECVGVYHNAEYALEKLPELQPRIVLMDIGLPSMTGNECASALKKLIPSVHILMFTVFEDPDRIFEALQAGAGGYLLKSATKPRIVEAIFDLANGGSPLTPQVARKLVDVFRPDPLLANLTPRETEILGLLAQGLQYRHIAEQLFISVKTVGRHIFNIYEKLHVNTNVDAVRKYLRGRM